MRLRSSSMYYISSFLIFLKALEIDGNTLGPSVAKVAFGADSTPPRRQAQCPNACLMVAQCTKQVGLYPRTLRRSPG